MTDMNVAGYSVNGSGFGVNNIETEVLQGDNVSTGDSVGISSVSIEAGMIEENALVSNELVDDLDEEGPEDNMQANTNNASKNVSEINSLMREFGLNTANGLDYLKDSERFEIDSFIMSDANKLDYALQNGKTLEEVFVPTFNNLDEAKSNLDAGDVFQLEGDSNRIGIKLSDGSIQKLDLSPEMYLKLFPPVEKYSVKQGRVADCYLLSTLDSMMKTPNGFAKILSCFHEHQDGSVSVTFPNDGKLVPRFEGASGRSSFLLEAGKEVSDYVEISEMNFFGSTINPDNPEDCIAQTAKGLQMLEHLYGLEQLHINVDKNENSQNLLNAMHAENQDLSLIAELHHYYEEDLKNGDEATKLRGSGGSALDVFIPFGASGYSGVKNRAISLLGNPEQAQNLVFVAASVRNNETISKYGLSSQHVYNIKPYTDENGSVRCKVIDPYYSAFSLDLSLDDVNKAFNDICVADFN